ncbi:MAG: Terminase-like family protein [Euryarchaeota archaeon ADurb.Bin294]|nr:MAG: Terminase-like family protein [Euryarchaeota archaeon ADurb.Bin294]
MEQEPGSAGVDVIDHYSREVLRGYTFKGHKSTGSKVDRANPFSAHVEAGNVKVVKGHWNEVFFDELERFPSDDPKAHDDIVDACSLAFNSSTGVAEPGVVSRTVLKNKYSAGMGNWNKYRG